MKNVILLLLFICPALVSAQKLKKITEGDKYEKVIYYVLKSNQNVKHGNYQLVNDGRLLTNGFYKNGVKDSIWTEYSRNGNKKSEGSYFQDQRIGLWEFNNFKGEKEQVYDYTNKEIVYFKLSQSEEKSKVLIGSDTTLSLLDRPALYIGGTGAISQVLIQHMNYPQEAVEKEISGKVYISLMIDAEGKAFGHKVKKGFNQACDDEALRVIKMIPNNWAPGILNGKPVSTEFVIPVNFTLQ